jgi:hypothetical protein
MTKPETRIKPQTRMTEDWHFFSFGFDSSFWFRISGFCSALAILLACRCLSAAVWNLTDARFHSRSVEVESIDASGVHIAGAANSPATVLTWDDVLELTQNAQALTGSNGRFSLILRPGDLISGEPAALNGDTLQWQSARLGEINFPVDSLLAIIRSGSTVADLDESRTDDVVRLANGDATHGIITQISAGGVAIQAGDATPTLPWDSVNAVLFSTVPGNPPTPDGRMFRVQFVGDESLTAAAISLAGDKLSVVLGDKSSRQLDVATIAGIEQLNGPITWLTARKPAENIYKPFFNENFPTRFDHTVADGKPIRERFPSFHHGIGCHSYSKLVYDLDGKWAGFSTQFAIDSDSPLADVTVRIYLDDKVVFEQKNVKGGHIYPLVTVPLADAKRMSLEVDYGENYATEDRFVWLDPALIRILRR